MFCGFMRESSSSRRLSKHARRSLLQLQYTGRVRRTAISQNLVIISLKHREMHSEPVLLADLKLPSPSTNRFHVQKGSDTGWAISGL